MINKPIIKLDKDFWNQRYLDNEIGWDLGEISPPLKNYIDQLDDKKIKIIIPGCGNAYEAEYLFNKGFENVFLIDLSPIALGKFKNRVPNFPHNQLICGNFFNHNEKYDLIVEQTFFCAINPSLRSLYAKHTSDILTPKGKLIGLLFNDKLNSDHPPFGGNKKEYHKCFKPYFSINIMENTYNSVKPRNGRELFIKLTKK